MELNTYFFDTYALVEIIGGSPSYDKYKNCFLITTKFNLMELHYTLLRLYNKEKADFYYNYFLKFIKDVSDNVIKDANEFKFFNRKKNLSYVDCIGYILAKILNVKFLTGDKEFENLENVEFVR